MSRLALLLLRYRQGQDRSLLRTGVAKDLEKICWIFVIYCKNKRNLGDGRSCTCFRKLEDETVQPTSYTKLLSARVFHRALLGKSGSEFGKESVWEPWMERESPNRSLGVSVCQSLPDWMTGVEIAWKSTYIYRLQYRLHWAGVSTHKFKRHDRTQLMRAGRKV